MRVKPKEVVCRVDLAIKEATDTEIGDLVQIARDRGNTVEVTHLPDDGYKVIATFGEDVTGAREFIKHIDTTARVDTD